MTDTMFGTDPALLQQALQQQQHQSWQQDIQPDVFSLGQRLGNQAGGMLGNALGNATGYVDPRIADAQLMQKVQQEALADAQTQGIDPAQDPVGFGKVMANKYLQIGKPDKAFTVLQQIQGMEAQKAKTALDFAKTQTELKKATAEQSPFAKVDVSKFSPQSVEAFKQSGNYSDLRLVEGGSPLFQEVGVVGDPTKKQKVMSTDQGKTWQPIHGAWDLRASAPTTNVEVASFNKVGDARKDFRLENQKDIDDLRQIASAKKLTAGAGGSPLAAAAIKPVLASIFGDSQQAQAEIKAIGNTGALPQRIVNNVTAFLAGTATTASREDINAVLGAMEKVKASKIKENAKQYMKRTDLTKENKEFITMGVLNEEAQQQTIESVSKSGKPIVSKDGGKTWEYK